MRRTNERVNRCSEKNRFEDYAAGDRYRRCIVSSARIPNVHLHIYLIFPPIADSMEFRFGPV